MPGEHRQGKTTFQQRPQRIPKLLARSADVPSAAWTVHMFRVADSRVRAPPTTSGCTGAAWTHPAFGARTFLSASAFRPLEECPKGLRGNADPIPFFLVFVVAFCQENRRQRREQDATAREWSLRFERTPHPGWSELRCCTRALCGQECPRPNLKVSRLRRDERCARTSYWRSGMGMGWPAIWLAWPVGS
jgi:hypothetical protein